MPKPLLTEERRRRFHQALQAIDGTGLDGATVLGDGYSAQAWLLADGETVARIPKYAWAEIALVYEVSILQLLEQAHLPCETPRNARQVRDSAGFVGALHRYVAGTPLYERIEAIRDTRAAEALMRGEMQEVQRLVRETMHSMGISEEQLREFEEQIRKQMEGLGGPDIFGPRDPDPEPDEDDDDPRYPRT